jgi:hypothetical protein
MVCLYLDLPEAMSKSEDKYNSTFMFDGFFLLFLSATRTSELTCWCFDIYQSARDLKL